ncbi:DUF5711 family protein [Herbinix luporum]|uniref:Uncharacterized protein n=1 Tax=Herbinix luporum TaxID=1679721 RepID=A0A0K8J2Z5_9FIRM|nr:DUF5711 family protein [Herbinix luporum]MDI9488822.1 DUF5711 family protein [Bacillota bacterium]CUH91668.1 hypothetical protein SD1D_0106 [Herbinix luporum]HHT56275.1 hypothetical protein [Herbinix luporum]
MRDYESRRKRYRRNKTIVFTSLLILIVIIGAVYIYELINRDYQDYEVIKRLENTEENLGGYLEYNGAVVRYSKDGALAIDIKGNLLWNGSFEMSDPIADTCGDYVAIADRGSKQVSIFNKKGLAGSITTNHPIIKVQVANQGVVAILMIEDETSYIEIYSKEGELLGEKITNVVKDGYPMDFTLSHDGKKIGATYLCINKGEIINNLLFLNFGEVGKNFTDRTVGALIYNGKIVPRITFLDNDTVCAFTEEGFLIFTMEEKAEIYKEEIVEGEIKSVLHNEKYVGLVIEGKETKKSSLYLYDLKGNRVLNKELDFDYDTIYLSKDEIIMYDDLSCVIYKTNGQAKFRYTFTTNISALYPINHLDNYFLVNPKEILEIQLVE